jgi:hypothetical protein
VGGLVGGVVGGGVVGGGVVGGLEVGGVTGIVVGTGIVGWTGDLDGEALGAVVCVVLDPLLDGCA